VRRRLLVLCLSGCACLLPACSQSNRSTDGSESHTYFPTWSPEPGGARATGLLAGRLVLRNGCLFWDAGEQGINLPIWPASYRLGADEAIVTDHGQEVALGKSAALGGGERTLKEVRDMIGSTVPRQCRASGYWLVTEVILDSA
jgi:hypothetical protein